MRVIIKLLTNVAWQYQWATTPTFQQVADTFVETREAQNMFRHERIMREEVINMMQHGATYRQFGNWAIWIEK